MNCIYDECINVCVCVFVYVCLQKAPLPMPSNNGTATAATAKKENEESTNEGKGIAARILGPCKPVMNKTLSSSVTFCEDFWGVI